jgi:hypothetical protein
MSGKVTSLAKQIQEKRKASDDPHKLEFLSDIEIFSDEEDKNDFRSQLRKRLREIKRKKIVNSSILKNKNVKTTANETEGKTMYTVVELDPGKEKLILNRSISTLNEPKDLIIFKDFVEKNLFIPGSREFSKDEEKIIEGWRSYSKNSEGLRRRENRRFFLNKIIIGFGTLFLVLILSVIGTAYIIYNIFDIFKSIKEVN